MSETPTVLVVEDEESFVDALLLGLKREGFRVEVARDHVLVEHPAGDRDRAADDDRPGKQGRQDTRDLDPVTLPAAGGGERCRLAELGVVRDRRSHPSAVLRD